MEKNINISRFLALALLAALFMTFAKEQFVKDLFKFIIILSAIVVVFIILSSKQLE